MIESDIDDTIAYWRRRGVTVADIARALHCRNNWTAIKTRMLHWAFVRWEGWV